MPCLPFFSLQETEQIYNLYLIIYIITNNGYNIGYIQPIIIQPIIDILSRLWKQLEKTLLQNFKNQKLNLKKTLLSFLKSHLPTSDMISSYLEARYDYEYFILNYSAGLYHSTIQLDSTKIEGVAAIFAIKEILVRPP